MIDLKLAQRITWLIALDKKNPGRVQPMWIRGDDTHLQFSIGECVLLNSDGVQVETRTLELANIKVRRGMRGKGLTSALLSWLEREDGYAVCILPVVTARFATALEARGYRKRASLYPNEFSYYKL